MFFSLFKELAKKVPSLLLSPYEEKRNILEKIKKLLDAEDFRSASRELDKLSEDFKRAGRCKKEEEDELWTEFKSLKDQFYEKRREYYESLEASNLEKRNKKLDIIARAKEICEQEEDMRKATQKMDELRKEWKEVGFSGKGDDALWNEFAKVLDEFREKKKEHHSEMLKVFEERINKKEELIKRAKKILADAEFTDEEIESIKALRTEYKAIGFAGKERDDELYQEFNKVIQQYFEEMKFYK